MIRPISFNKESVEAILNNKKSLTIRPIKPQPQNANSWLHHSDYYSGILGNFYPDTKDAIPKILTCPYGDTNDFLWVKESLKRGKRLEFLEEKILEEDERKGKYTAQYVAYTTPVSYSFEAKEGWCGTALWQWKNKYLPSLFMPRWACRITLVIKLVRADRIQNISYLEILENGTPEYRELLNREAPEKQEMRLGKELFIKDWDFIYRKTEYSWNNNPWVWIIHFNILETKR
jgi:hypothetical protein